MDPSEKHLQQAFKYEYGKHAEKQEKMKKASYLSSFSSDREDSMYNNIVRSQVRAAPTEESEMKLKQLAFKSIVDI